MFRYRQIPPILSLAIALAACGRGEAAKNAEAAAAAQGADSGVPAVANTVVITAREYAFDAPDTIQAGLTTFRLVDAGRELHHVQLVKLDDGKTADDFVRTLRAGGPPPAWAHEAGGTNPPRPAGGEASATLEVQPGSYALVCFVPGPDGVPHVMKGMIRPLTVVPATGPAAAEPAADVVIRMTDYGYTLSTPITAGSHTIRLENAGPQPHELVLARLAPGKTAADLARWILRQQGPPPGEPLGGVSAIQPGSRAFVTQTFTPGEYALLCFIPDRKDGKPHAVHGMVKQITID